MHLLDSNVSQGVIKTEVAVIRDTGEGDLNANK